MFAKLKRRILWWLGGENYRDKYFKEIEDELRRLSENKEYIAKMLAKERLASLKKETPDENFRNKKD